MELVSRTESQVGKYVDINGDGIVDGIIFADLLFGSSGRWVDSDGDFTIPTITESKDYYVSQNSYTDSLGGTVEVLTPISDGLDRFYIMALSDMSTSRYSWYYDAYDKINDYTITSGGFGGGKQNTLTMISKWNSKFYGEQGEDSYYKDLWGQIQERTNNGWFVPSRGEWAAFGANLNINPSNYLSKGLSDWYWSSSLYYSPNTACIASFYSGYIFDYYINSNVYVRLAATC